ATGWPGARKQEVKFNMARRITKSAAKSKAHALKISTFLDLPGAIFVGTPSNADLEIARHRISSPSTKPIFARSRFTTGWGRVVVARAPRCGDGGLAHHATH